MLSAASNRCIQKCLTAQGGVEEPVQSCFAVICYWCAALVLSGVWTLCVCVVVCPFRVQVCIEYDNSDSQQWVCLVNSTFIQAVYIEDCLVWAKRILLHRPSGVAWPARAFKLLAGQSAHAAGTVVIEYLMDAERSMVPVGQIKELTVWEGVVGCEPGCE